MAMPGKMKWQQLWDVMNRPKQEEGWKWAGIWADLE